jgi:hypothetical protein
LETNDQSPTREGVRSRDCESNFEVADDRVSFAARSGITHYGGVGSSWVFWRSCNSDWSEGRNELVSETKIEGEKISHLESEGREIGVAIEPISWLKRRTSTKGGARGNIGINCSHYERRSDVEARKKEKEGCSPDTVLVRREWTSENKQAKRRRENIFPKEKNRKGTKKIVGKISERKSKSVGCWWLLGCLFIGKAPLCSNFVEQQEPPVCVTHFTTPRAVSTAQTEEEKRKATGTSQTKTNVRCYCPPFHLVPIGSDQEVCAPQQSRTKSLLFIQKTTRGNRWFEDISVLRSKTTRNLSCAWATPFEVCRESVGNRRLSEHKRRFP